MDVVHVPQQSGGLSVSRSANPMINVRKHSLDHTIFGCLRSMDELDVPQRRPRMARRHNQHGSSLLHASLPGYAPTYERPALAIELGVGRVLVKYESERLGLPSFKVLGTSWAVERLLAEDGDARVLVTATEGNHGRALARVARQRRECSSRTRGS